MSGSVDRDVPAREAAHDAVRVFAARHTLSGRETEVLASFVVERLSTKEIATKLVLSYGTIREYWTRICRKTGARNATEVVLAMLTDMARADSWESLTGDELPHPRGPTR